MDLKRKLDRLSVAGLLGERIQQASVGIPDVSVSGAASAALSRAASGAKTLGADGEARACRLAELRTRIDELILRETHRLRPRVQRQVRALPATARPGSGGSLYVCERRYSLDHRHGRAPLSACLSAAAADIAKLALDPALAGVDPRRLLFFDLETTGLAGGTGTLAFITGLAYFDDTELRVEQLFLPEPGEEGPMLAYVAERVAAASALVSFNGKSFDWPLLRTRYLINRLLPPEPARHLDLLHCARRIFRWRLPQMRLGELEREVLGFEREGDIDGALIPASYFAFLRDGDGSRLAPVFTHNAYDLCALVATVGRLTRMFAAVADEDPRDHFGLATVAARAGDWDRALLFATAAAEHPSGRLAVAGRRLSADVLWRRGEFARAIVLLQRALAEATPTSTEAAAIRLRLAKLYEHRLADFESALAHARGTVPAEDAASQQRRVRRLSRRLGTQGRVS